MTTSMILTGLEGNRLLPSPSAKGVKLDFTSAVTAFVAASADPASVFADRTAYEKYLPLCGNVSHGARTTYWTKPVDPPAGSR